MKGKLHSPEQVIRKLRTADQLLNQGQSVADECRALEVSAATYHRWQQLYGGMKATEAKRLKELEQENTRLSRGVRPWKSSSNGRRPDHAHQLS